MVFTYSNMAQVLALNVEKISSFCLLHLVEVSALKMLNVCFALVMVTFICFENVSLGSRAVVLNLFGTEPPLSNASPLHAPLLL